MAASHVVTVRPVSTILPRYLCPRPAGRGGTAEVASPHRLCTVPACPLGCPSHCSPGLPTPGSSPHPLHRRPVKQHERWATETLTFTFACVRRRIWLKPTNQVHPEQKHAFLFFLRLSQVLLHPPDFPLTSHFIVWHKTNSSWSTPTAWNKSVA